MRRALIIACALLIGGPVAGCAEDIKAPTVTLSVLNSGAIFPGQVVQLDGSESTDPNNPALPLAFRWELTGVPFGSNASFNDATLARPSFVPDLAGTYTVRLTVGNGILTTTAEPLEIAVDDCGADLAVESLTATPDAPATGQVTQLAAVIAGAETPCETNNAVTYTWAFKALPAGSMAALNDAHLENPSFTPDVPGTYVVELVLSDNLGRFSVPAELEITASDCGSNAPEALNPSVTPAAPNVGDVVQLDTSVSDADVADPCLIPQEHTFVWTLVQTPPGSAAALSSPTARNPWVLVDEPGLYVAEVVITDSTGLSSRATTVQFTADACGDAAPVVQAGAATPANPVLGQAVELSATVTDSDVVDCGLTQAMAYHWTLVTAPTGSAAALNDAALHNPSVTPDVPGTYAAWLVVTDDTGRSSAPFEVSFTAADCGEAAPSVVVNAPAGGFETLAWAELDATVTDADNDAACGLAQTFTYHWEILDQPLEAEIVIDNPASATPGAWVSMAGDYVIGLTVTDSAGVVGYGQATLTATTCGDAAPDAAIDLTAPYVAGPGAAVVSPDVVPPGTAIVLRGDSSSDPDDAAPCSRMDELAYSWRFLLAPPGSQAWIGGDDLVEASFIPDVPGLYRVGLVVSDGWHDSAEATFDVQVDQSLSIGAPDGGSVAFVAGGAGLGFDRPTGVIQVGSDVYVVNEGNDTVLRIDTAGGNAVSLLSTGAFLNAPRRIAYDPGADQLYVLNGDDDFVIQIDRATGAQVRYIGDTALAEDIDFFEAGGVPQLAVAGRFLDQIDFYTLTQPPMSPPVAQTDFGGNLVEPYCVEVHRVDPDNHIYASSLEIGPTGGARLRHAPGGDLYLDDAFEALFFEDLSLDDASGWLYAAVGGGFDTIVRIDDCLGDGCAREIYASGFGQLGGIFVVGPDEVLATDAADNVVYRITIP